jgi:RNA polymerase sigma factor (sigma-70 family)
MTSRTPPPTEFDGLWRAREPALRRQAAVLFDDPQLRPAPSPDELLHNVRPLVVARWPADGQPGRREEWLLVEVTRELLGVGWRVYDGPVRGMLGRKVWSEADVDELAQGAAARSVRRLGELVARPRPLFGWLCLLARQQRAEWLRRGGAGRELTGASLDGFPDPADSGTTPTQAERRTRVRDMYDRVLAGLAPDEARLLLLTTERGLRPAEVASELGISVGNARQRVFRARCAAARGWQALFPEAAAELAALGLFPPGTLPT